MEKEVSLKYSLSTNSIISVLYLCVSMHIQTTTTNLQLMKNANTSSIEKKTEAVR